MATSLAPGRPTHSPAVQKSRHLGHRSAIVLGFGLDFVGLLGAWYCTFHLRLLLNPLFSRELTSETLAAVAPPVAYLAALWLATSLWLSFYRPQSRIRGADRFIELVESVVIASTLSIVVTFFSREFGAEMSRSFVLLFMPVSLIVMSITRFLSAILTSRLQERYPERVGVIGTHEAALRVAERLRDAADSTFAGIILPQHCKEAFPPGQKSVLGTTSMLAELINRTALDRIIIVNGAISEHEEHRCSLVSSRMGVVLDRLVPLPLTGARIDLSERFGMLLLESRAVAFTRRQEIVKRFFDVVISGLTLMLVAPALIVFALLIRLTSPGPVFYRAPRVGRGGRYFQFLKFRSMYTDMDRKAVDALNEKNGKIFKIRRDPRITPVGRFMRRYSIDELPQLFNVLRGEMSLVGPRPLPAEDLDPDGQSREFAEWSETRSRALPGITGLWQIRGRSDLPFEKMIDLDVEYIRTWSLDLDVQILLATPLVVITGKGAY